MYVCMYVCVCACVEIYVCMYLFVRALLTLCAQLRTCDARYNMSELIVQNILSHEYFRGL